MCNVFLKDSPFEADAIRVTKACYWHEYEIKISVADYHADFQKTAGYGKQGDAKHDLYSSDSAIVTRWGIRPKPKSFSFVVPIGLLEGIDVPAHCGIIEYGEKLTYWNVKVKRPSPTLKNATKLTPEQIFNLACKAACRINI